MSKPSKQTLKIATVTLIISLIGLIGGFLSIEDSPLQGAFTTIAFYGTIITVCLLLLHLLIVFISFLVRVVRDEID